MKGKMKVGFLVSVLLGSLALQSVAMDNGMHVGTLKENLARDNKIIRIEPDKQRLLRNPQT